MDLTRIPRPDVDKVRSFSQNLGRQMLLSKPPHNHTLQRNIIRDSLSFHRKANPSNEPSFAELLVCKHSPINSESSERNRLHFHSIAPRKRPQLVYPIHTHPRGKLLTFEYSLPGPGLHLPRKAMLGPWSTPSRIRVSRNIMLASQRQVSVPRRWQSSKSSVSTANLPLDGVRVLDVTRVLAGVCLFLPLFSTLTLLHALIKDILHVFSRTARRY